MDNIRQEGKGNGFRSDECDKIMEAVRKFEAKAPPNKPPKYPVFSSDLVNFAITCNELDLTNISNMLEPLWSEEASLAAKVEAVYNFIKAAAVYNIFRLIPNLTRTSAHRGEAYNLTSRELQADPLGLRDEPRRLKTAQGAQATHTQ